MDYLAIHLKERFPILGQDGRDPVLHAYVSVGHTQEGHEEELLRAVVICPGGGYGYCSRREWEPVAYQFLARGYHAFVLEYSTAPHHFPAQLQEVAAALETIHAQAAAWRCDAGKIALMGFSAGGHLAAQYANAYDLLQVRQAVPDSKGVAASILCYPVISAQPGQSHPGSFFNLTGREDPDPRLFSCQELVSHRTPPTFLWHTAEDQSVPVVNSLLYAQALTEHHVPFELHVFPAGPHGLSTATPFTNHGLPSEVLRNSMWMDLLAQWLEMTL